MEDQLEKEARFRQLMAHSSHDSAIDTDSIEWETEVVEFEKHRVRTIMNLVIFSNVYSVNNQLLNVQTVMILIMLSYFRTWI